MPTATARARPTRRPAAKPRSPAADSVDALAGVLDDRQGKPRSRRAPPRGPTHRRVAPRIARRAVRDARISAIDAVSISARDRATGDRLARMVAAAPLKRTHRKRYRRFLARTGQWDAALTHAKKWAELDGSEPHALLATADALAAAGRRDEALRVYSAAIEVQPWSTRMHRRLAEMYRLQGDPRRQCAHLWSIMSIEPANVRHHLAVARCLSRIEGQRDSATRILTTAAGTRSGKRMASTIGRALVDIQRGVAAPIAARRITRTGLSVQARWDAPIDLDVAVITPAGERLSVISSVRSGVAIHNSKGGQIAEALQLRSPRNGAYIIEIVNPSPSAAPVHGTVDVRVRGKRRSIPFVIEGARRVVAVASMTTRYERVWMTTPR